MSLFDQQITQQQLDSLYNWVDNLPLSRPKRNISRDFSDAVLMAQIINYYFPKKVELHNYPPTNSIKSKLENWRTLNNKVLSKIGINLTADDCQKLSSATPMYVQILLNEFKNICGEEDRERVIQNQTQNPNRNQTYEGGSISISQPTGGYGRNLAANTNNQNIEQKSNKSNRRDLRGAQVTKVEELKEILKLLKEKIAFVSKNIQRKDAEIKELQDIIQLGI